MTSEVESLVSGVNNEITKANEKIKTGEIPDFARMDEFIVKFTEEVKKLPDEDAKQYTPLLDTWKVQITSINQALGVIKDEVQKKIDSANQSNDVANLYKTNNE